VATPPPDALQYLTELAHKHDDLLDRLEELNQRVLAALAEFSPAKEAVAPDMGGGRRTDRQTAPQAKRQ
jgi:hypothetical protein